MKTESGEPSSTGIGAGGQVDAKKLLSLLALAAAAVPQTSKADIIYTNLATPITIGSGNDTSYDIVLPGVARLGFRFHSAVTAVTSSRWITAGRQAGYVRLRTNASFVVPVGAGRVWSTIGGFASAVGTVGFANYYSHGPNSYNNLFLAFKFQDSTAGNAPRYGWLQLSLSNPVNNSGPDVTITAYAWDTSGAQLATGAVPEPSSMSILALGALAFGAKGMRSWRAKRGTQPKSPV